MGGRQIKCWGNNGHGKLGRWSNRSTRSMARFHRQFERLLSIRDPLDLKNLARGAKLLSPPLARTRKLGVRLAFYTHARKSPKQIVFWLGSVAQYFMKRINVRTQRTQRQICSQVSRHLERYGKDVIVVQDHTCA